MRRSYFYCF